MSPASARALSRLIRAAMSYGDSTHTEESFKQAERDYERAHAAMVRRLEKLEQGTSAVTESKEKK